MATSYPLILSPSEAAVLQLNDILGVTLVNLAGDEILPCQEDTPVATLRDVFTNGVKDRVT